MTCDKCGFKTNPGDQICINCGAELSLNNIVVPNVDLTITMPEQKETEKNDRKKFITICIIGVVAVILLVAIIAFVWIGR